MPVGNALFDSERDFKCVETNNNLIVLNNGGAAYLFFYTLDIYLFSFMIWYVFYRIPDNFGLISKTR